MSVFQYDYYPLLGGIQKIKADIQLTKISDTTYKVKSKIYILDWYGSDKEDIEIISNEESVKLDEINSDLNKMDNFNSFGNRYLYLENRYKYLETYIRGLLKIEF
ncbi:MAG: hypothetical protein R3Y22_00400 [Bacteroidales bacterium]